jgi:2-oxoisovalerate dehydrogenase E1 component alpha subunit
VSGAVDDSVEVASFSIKRTCFVDRDGTVRGTLPDFAADRDALVALYRGMILTRALDAKAVALQRTGRLHTYASSLGQEGVSVGVGAAMRAEDVLLPSFREQGAQLLRGTTARELLLYWGGDERGSDFAGPREDFPIAIPVATHVPHAVGVALAFQLRAEARVAVCVCGDGATSKGDFYESINAAGVWKLPAVFVVNDNQWAISVPRAEQTAAATLAQKAVAAGIEGLQVDGNDVIAVRHVVQSALAKARAGGGATLVEALTYRLADHTTADDARRYRDEAEVSEQRRGEPVARLAAFLRARGMLGEDQEREITAACEREIEQAAADYLATPPEPTSAMFDSLFAELPDDLVDQRAAAIAESDGDG